MYSRLLATDLSAFLWREERKNGSSLIDPYLQMNKTEPYLPEWDEEADKWNQAKVWLRELTLSKKMARAQHN